MEKIKIKGRALQHDSKPGQRLGSIKLDKDWDYAMLAMFDAKFNPLVIYEAKRLEIEDALRKPGSLAKNERGQLSVSKFKSISRVVWQV